MKLLKNTFTILFILSTQSFPQFYADSVLADEIVEFVNIANEKAGNFYLYDRPNIEFTDDELEYLLDLYYKCYSFYPVCFNDYMAEEHKKWEKASLNVPKAELKLRPWLRIYALVDELSETYGSKFITITGTPAIIKCKYIELSYSTHILKGTDTKFRVHNFIFVVEEVLKGDNYFQPGDIFSVDMIPNIESPAPSFIPEKSYFLPVTTIMGHQDDAFNTVFVYLVNEEDRLKMGQPPQTFPIENGIINNCEYFGISDTSWTDFKIYFRETYMIFD